MRSQSQRLSCLLLVLFVLGTSQQSGTAFQNQNESGTEAESTTQSGNREATDFLRIQTDEFGSPMAMQTATAKYVLEDAQGNVVFEVSLESVIHVADASYYRGFQNRFDRYDVVLFESILKEDKNARAKESDLPSGFKMFQQVSTGTLGLAYQFDEINYDGKSMVNADLTPEEIKERIADRGDNKTTLFSDMLAHIIQKMTSPEGTETSGGSTNPTENAGDVKSPLSELKLSILTDADGIMKIRRLMSGALVHSELLESTYPPSIQKILVGDRNDRIMSVLKSEREKGSRNVAVFFGVSHMADLEQRLIDGYGMKLKSVNWRNAWDLRDGAVEGAPLEGLIESTFKDSFKSKLKNFAKGLQDRGNDSSDQADSEKDEKIDEMEKTLEALKARLKEMEEQKEKDDDDS